MIEELDRMNSIISESLFGSKPDSGEETKQYKFNYGGYPALNQSDATNNDITVVFSPETVPDMLLDEKEIRQLILNLVRNGLEAMQQAEP